MTSRIVFALALLASTLARAAITFTLVNAATDKDIGSLVEGQTIYLSDADKLNVRANVAATGAGSVTFGVDSNANYRVERNAPFALAGNTGADYAPWTPAVGSHSISAKSLPNGETLRVNFIVAQTRPTTQPGGPTGDIVVAPGGSLLAAINACPDGKTILVKNGTYKETLSFRKRITIQGESRAGVIIDANGQETIVNAGSATFNDLTIRNANGMLQASHAAVKITSGTKLNRVTIEDCSATGLSINAPLDVDSGIRLTDVTIQRCGQQALSTQARDVILTRCLWLGNNCGYENPKWKGFQAAGYPDTTYAVNGKYFVNPSWEAGGEKNWTSNKIRYFDCESRDNLGPGFWVDYRNTDVQWTRCKSSGAKGRAGKAYEGEGWRLELTNSPASIVLTDCVAEKCSGAAVTFTCVNGVRVYNFKSLYNAMCFLIRADDSRGNVTDVVTTNTTNTGGSALKTVWGSKPYSASIN